MSASIEVTCSQCRKEIRAPYSPPKPVSCPECNHQLTDKPLPEDFSSCPLCESKHFYRQKDFNRTLGLGLILLGAILVPFTYGISLPVIWLFDLMLYRKVPNMAVCYKCDAEYREFKIPESVKPYSHYTADYSERFEQKTAS